MRNEADLINRAVVARRRRFQSIAKRLWQPLRERVHRPTVLVANGLNDLRLRHERDLIARGREALPADVRRIVACQIDDDGRDVGGIALRANRGFARHLACLRHDLL